MRVLICSSQVFPVPPRGYGGLELIVYDLAVELGNMGHEVYVLCPGGSRGKDQGEPYNIITPEKGGPHNPEHYAYDSIKPALKDFDIIHSHGWGGHVYLAKRENPKLTVLQTLHGPMPFYSKPIEKPCFIAASEAHARFLKKELNFDCKVVHHGINLDNYPFQAEKEDFLLYCSRVSEEKGALQFVELCKSVGMRGMLTGPDIYVQSGLDYVRRVMVACEDSGGLVRYIGEVQLEYKVELLQKARCLVSPLIPPYIEIFGLILVEAMACGTPVLITDRGAPREIVIHGKTGAIARDTECLAENLQVALKCSPEDCRARAEEFPRSKMAQEYLKLYEEILGGGEW